MLKPALWEESFRKAMPPDKIKDAVESNVDIVLGKIVTEYPWDFCMKTYNLSGGTVADQAEYTAEGEDNDCLRIHTIYYGDNYDALEQLSPVDVREKEKSYTFTAVCVWEPSGRANGNPKFKLHKTPSTAGENLRIYYWRDGVGISEFTDDFAALFAAGIMAELTEDYNKYEHELKKRIAFYVGGTGDIRAAQLDPTVARRNRERAKLHGWGRTNVYTTNND